MKTNITKEELIYRLAQGEFDNEIVPGGLRPGARVKVGNETIQIMDISRGLYIGSNGQKYYGDGSSVNGGKSIVPITNKNRGLG